MKVVNEATLGMTVAVDTATVIPKVGQLMPGPVDTGPGITERRKLMGGREGTRGAVDTAPRVP